jgi:bacteriophage N4 adsorption protein B
MLDIVSALYGELTLFAAAGFALLGLDDLLVDLIWIVRRSWRAVTVYQRIEPATAATLRPPQAPGWIAVFIPAWDEADVIGSMLHYSVQCWQGCDVTLFVGCYANDAATIAAVRHLNIGRVRLVISDQIGPTTKADCLNSLWNALGADEKRLGARAKAIVLHDAEDLVHPAEIRIFDTLIERFALVQLPVFPSRDKDSRWISGHYIDEFTENHLKELVVREAIGASLPSAGVGCAIDRSVLEEIAGRQDGKPFDADSLTEDYELGLKIGRLGYRSAFVRLAEGGARRVVAVRAHFPATLETAVRQKTRWILGIALAGWDRVGWQGGLMEGWMRLRDRRAILAAILLLAGYVSLVLTALLAATGRLTMPVSTTLSALIMLDSGLLLWRLLVRMLCVGYHYGGVEGLRAAPRMITSNIVAIMAARRAVWQYLGLLRGRKLRWDKTTHRFPETTEE